jgi:hypothetical protein
MFPAYLGAGVAAAPAVTFVAVKPVRCDVQDGQGAVVAERADDGGGTYR